MRTTTVRSSVFILLAGAIAACTATAVNPSDSDSGMMPIDDSGGQNDSSMREMDSTTGTDTGTVVDSGHDSAVHDTGITDAPFDGIIVTDASFDPPGSPCPTNNLIERDPNCGICGYRERVCLALTDGGATKWQPWGACQAEVAGGCMPGTSDTTSCGFCGTQSRTCQSDCSWANIGSCAGSGMCNPGDVQFAASVSCDAGLGRSRTCDAVCAWGNYSSTCGTPPPPPTAITISATAGQNKTARFTLEAVPINVLFSGACPTTVDTTATYAKFLKVINPRATPANVSIWSSLQAGGVGTLTDTIMTSYPGTAMHPSTDAQRMACVLKVSDDCKDTTTDPSACTNNGAGLMKADSSFSTGPFDGSVTIPASSFIWVYVAGLNGSSTDNGDVQITTHTH